MNSFAARLLRLFYESGLTQAKISKDIGMSGAHFHNLLCGKRNPTLKSSIAIADYFNVSIDWLLGRSNERSIR